MCGAVDAADAVDAVDAVLDPGSAATNSVSMVGKVVNSASSMVAEIVAVTRSQLDVA